MSQLPDDFDRQTDSSPQKINSLEIMKQWSDLIAEHRRCKPYSGFFAGSHDSDNDCAPLMLVSAN